ncbi:inositol 2-dehydrogenase [Treponema phagedenis]|uniref:Oxidoreductase, NAD-binding domain protein n=1 Tax=Treponema phagedenis TaxID=162 RepID=A0A0B7GVH0_TREPH|nr:inositol 2-dehydrogenase [Treponema phagedenis]NVP23072.1 inositol 2-dehydrogenase [Treponema phagedenis]QEK00968.1 inositol 2-dehydrogenase [Treponema phagedenis]QEK03635.1 inositol 2-dehydrogenase [Treponema phagedenis]QEK05977.1 inositol 2-dehydrogenase [Treponema phagedenis]QEK09253.1 inositol 2-dehydrogenase [Treponema phagedenis]
MKQIKIGSIGLGRLGLEHAKNIAGKIADAELYALCDMDEQKLHKAAQELRVEKTCTSFEELIAIKELDAIVIVSPSALHCKHISEALRAGKHVFCEKPLGTSLEECTLAEKAVEAHPDKVFMLGFMRRFDESYMYAKQKIAAGEIGRPVLFRSYSQDPIKCIDGAIAFAPHSGGEFYDMSSHDIDLARWMLESEPESVYAIGGCYAYPEFAKYEDGDNVSCLMKFKNEAMAFLFAGRTAPHGYNVETEIIGTKATLRIASVPQKNLVEILDTHGVRKECSENFQERFSSAYVNEVQEFVRCIIENRKPNVSVYDGTAISIIAGKCTESFKTGKLVTF